jgi:16S rRNA G966 N2-methylase RsmD
MGEYHGPRWRGATTFRPEWVDSQPVRKVVREQTVGRVLTFPSGASPLGDVAADIDVAVNPDVRADLENPPFARRSFDTVYCDPPYTMYRGDQSWVQDIWDIARKRLICQTPRCRIHIPDATKRYILVEPAPGSAQRYVTTLQVFTRRDHSLSEWA